MISEEKRFTFSLAFLLIYGLTSLFTLGTFLLPLPLFESAMALLALSFAIDTWKGLRTKSILFIAFAFCTFFSRTYNWQFFMGDAGLMTVEKFALPDIAYLLAASILLGLLAYPFKRIRQQGSIWVILCLLCFILGLVINQELLFVPLLQWSLHKLYASKSLFVEGNTWVAHYSLFLVARQLTLHLL